MLAMPGLGGQRLFEYVAFADAVSECLGVVGFIPGLILPAVKNLECLCRTATDKTVLNAPFVLGVSVFMAYDIEIIERRGRVLNFDYSRPVFDSVKVKFDGFCLVVGSESFNVSAQIH